MQHLHKVMICYIGIILITSILYVYTKNHGVIFYPLRIRIQPLQEGLTNPFAKISSGAKDVADKANDAIIGPIKDLFKPITDFVSQSIHDIASLKTRGENFQKSFKTLGTAFEQEFQAIGQGTVLVGDDIAGAATTSTNYINDFFVNYLTPRFACGVQKIQDFNYCFVYYLVNIVLETIYTIFVRTPVYAILLFTGLDMTSQVDMVWAGIYCLDDIMYESVGLHVMRWSDEIMDRCFLCKNLTPLPDSKKVTRAFNKIGTDTTVTVPAMFNKANSSFTQFGNQLSTAILGIDAPYIPPSLPSPPSPLPPNAINTVKNTFTDAFGKLKNETAPVVNTVKNETAPVVNTVKNTASTVGNAFKKIKW